jgi:sodium transport system permease protein
LGEALLCGVLLLVIRFFAAFVFGTPDTWPRFATLTVVSLLAFVAAPALLMAVVLTRRPRKTLLLVMPRPASLAMAVLLALAIHPAGLAFAEGVKTLYPLSSEVAAQVRSIGRIIEQAPSLWGILLVLAIVPAVCEELAFRGFMLSGLRHMGHKWAAILACSVFFGATHGILQQSLNACALGIVLGYLAVQSGSILPPLLFHTTYNALTLALAWSVGPSGSAGPAWNWCFSVSESGASYRWPVIAASVLASACLLSWFRGLPWEASAEESLQQARSRGGGESGGQSQALKLPDTA